MRWREAKKDALYFDSSLQKQIEVTLNLQKELNALRESMKDYGAGCYENGLRNGRRKLEEQIEKMKNCKNCNKLKKEKDGLLVCTVGSFYTNVFGKNCDKWEIKENE
jgi:hypothetical protein